MRTLIILKGLVKSFKQKWVREQGLDNYFLDMDVLRKMYSCPDLATPEREILGKSFGDTVYKRFMEILNIRLSKGCLVIVDMDQEPCQVLETLALIYGYTVFYVIQDIPQDYIGKNKTYSIPYYPIKKRQDLEKEVTNFMNLQLYDKNRVNSFSDILEYWASREKTWGIGKKDVVLHVSDLHSNISLYRQLPDYKKYSLVVFHGDYIDGPEEGGSRALIERVLRANTPKIIWLEGNHEIRLRRYLGWLMLRGSGKKEVTECLWNSLPPDFLETTAHEFSDISGETAKTWLETLNSRLRLYARICMGDTEFICTHSGILWKEQIDPRFIGNLVYGNREMNRFDKTFSEASKKQGIVSVHAHCKYSDSYENQRYDRVINLDPPSENEIVYGEQCGGTWKIVCLKKE